MDAVFQAFAYAFWRAFFDALLEHGPQLHAMWVSLNTSTMQDAGQPPKGTVDALYQQVYRLDPSLLAGRK